MRSGSAGFTLIELSIVLVIIGLIVGGVLVGQDLIRAAYVRAQITQIEKFNTAVNTFYGKYQALPGDMNPQTAQEYGFGNHGPLISGGAGEGDGNGMIDGGHPGGTAGYLDQYTGETTVFWVDLSSATAGNLIEGGFSTAVFSSLGFGTIVPPQIALYLPPAKIGGGNYIYVYEYGGINYYGMSNVSSISESGPLNSAGSLSPMQAYNIDSKIDDGFPLSGNVQAVFVNNAGTGGTLQPVQSGSAAAGSYTSTTCFDSGALIYVTGYQNGQGASCGLSFKFQ